MEIDEIGEQAGVIGFVKEVAADLQNIATIHLVQFVEPENISGMIYPRAAVLTGLTNHVRVQY